MRKIYASLVLMIFLMSFASAELVINEQPNKLYNIGDVIQMPVKIITSSDLNEFMTLSLLCNGEENIMHQEYISLLAGEETTIISKIPLIPEFTKQMTGECKIKAVMGDQIVLTENFEITDIILVDLTSKQEKFKPGSSMLIEGTATKKNGEPVKGYVKVKLQGENETSEINVLESVKNGKILVNFSIPKDKAAGKYLVNLDVYEKDSNENITNKGFIDYTIQVTQVPTSLELILENEKVTPGTNAKIKAVLHDQTGEKIESTAKIIVKNKNEETREQVDLDTDEFAEIPIATNDPPIKWYVTAESNGLTAESKFEIIKKRNLQIDLVNKTIVATNIGNIPYSKIVLIKVGNENVNINITLDLKETKKYLLTAPDGNYKVSIVKENETKTIEGVPLTGKAIGAKEANSGVLAKIKLSVVWIFIIAILGFVAMTVFKKGYQRSFFGYIKKRKEKNNNEKEKIQSTLIEAKNPAELSLSIQGEKQNASIVCIKIKNLEEIKSEQTTKTSLQEIANYAENLKATTYENNDNIFFILSPIKTRTFKNEQVALKIAQKAKEILAKHNRLYKTPMEAGISINYGTIISKLEKKKLLFMTMGTLITEAKKIASISKGRILLGEKISQKLSEHIKTKKENVNGTDVYLITDIKNSEENKKFISNFVKSLEKK